MPEQKPRAAACRASLHALLDTLRETDEAALYERHPSVQSLLEAGYDELKNEPLERDTALLLSLVPALTRYMNRERFGARPVLKNARAAGEYLSALFTGIPVERFYMLTLNESGRLISCDLLQEGTLDEAPFYLSAMLRTAAAGGARAAVLCHNHPGGTPRPSEADLCCTLDAIRALHPMGVTLLDHIIIAGDRAVSLRCEGDISAELWLMQAADFRLLRKWTEG